MTEPAARKSADAFRTISEVAADLKLPQHVLRFWETRFPQVKPLKRAGGRRFYRPEDVDLLRAVKSLLYGDGYTIKGVQRILREQGPRAVAALAASPARTAAPRRTVQETPEPGEIAAAAVADLPVRPDPPPAPAAVEDVPWTDGTGPGPEPGDRHPPAMRLRAVLAELRDCVRLLDAARASPR